MKHPMGQRMAARQFGVSSNPFKSLLRNKSPDRSDPYRTSYESDRYSEDGDFEDSKRSMFDVFKRRPSRTPSNNLPKLSWHDDRDDHMPGASNDIIEGELNTIINTDESHFFRGKGSKPASIKTGGLKLDDDSSITSPKSPTQNKLMKMFQKKPKTLNRKGLANNSISAPENDITPSINIIPLDAETEAEKMLNLELADINPTPIDENLSIPHNHNQNQKIPMIILPKKFFELDTELEILQKDLGEIDAQLREGKAPAESSSAKVLMYSRRGIMHEINDIKEEKRKIEKSEIDNAIRVVLYF